MSCIVYTAIDNPNGVPSAREVEEHLAFFTYVQTLGASHGAAPHEWDINDLPSEFVKEGLDHLNMRAVIVPSLDDVEAIREKIVLHPDSAAVKKYNLDNGIVCFRKIVDADTHQVLVDWENAD